MEDLLYLRGKRILLKCNQEELISLKDINKSKVTDPGSLVEKLLLSRLKNGDSAAFSHIFIAYYKDLVMFAERFTRNVNSAEEIVQDTFVKLWEEHEGIDIKVSVRSYLMKMIQNKCIDNYRHEKIKQEHFEFIFNNTSQLEYSADDHILHSELQVEIDSVLEKLPSEISEAFRLNRYNGLKYHEIAKKTGVSVRTIEVRIGRALSMLRSFLKDYG